MAEAWTSQSAAGLAAPMSFDEPYQVIGIERRTPTISELWSRPLAGAMRELPVPLESSLASGSSRLGFRAHQRGEAFVVLVAGRAALEVRSHAGDARVGVAAGELELDVAVQVLEAFVARQLGARRTE
jgi:hypothetical protein